MTSESGDAHGPPPAPAPPSPPPGVQPSPSASSTAAQEQEAAMLMMERREYDGPRYELIFLDNQMPVMSGWDMVGKLRQLGRTDFIFGVTGMLFFRNIMSYFANTVLYRQCVII